MGKTRLNYQNIRPLTQTNYLYLTIIMNNNDLYNKIGITLLIGLGLIYLPIKFVALAMLIFGALFCLAWLFLIMPDEVAGSYDSHFEPAPWVDKWDEYRTTPDNLEPEPEKKPEVKKPDSHKQSQQVVGGRLIDEVAGTIEWDVNRKLK